MKTTLKALAARTLAYALASLIALEPAYAQVTISQTPLATSGGNSILANLMFILDDSGSMSWDYLPDYVDDARQCMVRSASGVPTQPDFPTGFGADPNSRCKRGDPPYETGGQKGSNGVAYDPHVRYRPGVKSDGSDYVTIDLNSVTVSPKTVPLDAYGIQSTSTVDVTSAITERTYCNASSGTIVCKRNGAAADGSALVSGTDASGNTMSAGRFPYRMHDSSSSSKIFGLPEMMAMATFARSGTTVTGTTLQTHGLAANDILFVSSTGQTGIDSNSVTLLTASGNTFTYTTPSGSGNISAKTGFYRKYVALSDASAFSRLSADSFVTVTSPGHGMVTGDRIRVVTGNSSLNPSSSPTSITRLDDNRFTYSGGSGDQSGSGNWVRTGLYNRAVEVSAPPATYSITPIEYCSDANLTDCVEVLPGNTPPSGFQVPAYVRFCQTEEQALATGAIGDASGTPRCRGKFVSSGATPWLWARYGLFNRVTIRSDAAPFARTTARSDCVGAPNCTYEEEIVNYALWFAYYRTRMQMMKTAAGRAFQSFISDPPDVQDKLRVGFITINPYKENVASVNADTVDDPVEKYLKVNAFNQSHAVDWYAKFYNIRPGPYTPLREALARVGWIYAGKLDQGLTENIPSTDDPVQAACQRNFALLTTDGYWNNENGQDLSGNPIGNHDNANPIIDVPYTAPSVDRATTGTFDGGVGTVITTQTPTTQEEQILCYGDLQTTFSSGDQTSCGCGPRQRRIIQRSFASTQRIATTDGAETLNDTVLSSTFTPVTDCADGNWQEIEQVKNVRQVLKCIDTTSGTPDPNTVTFWDGATQSCTACASGNSNRRVLIQQRQRAKFVTTKVDGFTTGTSLQPTTGGSTPYTSPPDYRWAGQTTTTEGSGNWKSSLASSGCNTNDISGTAYSETNSGGEVAGAVASESALVFIPPHEALVPNPTVPVVGSPSTTTAFGGYADTLADVAMYYYRTDLRGGTDPNGNPAGPALSDGTNPPGGDVSSNVVPAKAGAKNFVTHQHMVTFALGMVDGLMRYQPDYETAPSGDFFNVRNGTQNGCFWVTGTCNWPQPAEDSASALDDLWHAAVSGRGQYFLSKDIEGLQAGISGTLNAVNAQVAAAAASATSSPNITQTNNQIFSTTYETITWSGKVFAQTIDPNTGNVNAAIQWNADTLLLGAGDCSGTQGKACASADTRSLYTFDPTLANKVKPFAWGSLDDTEKAFFTDLCEGTPAAWQQCSSLAGSPRDTANDGASLVAYLRGQGANEGAIFRDRTFIDPATNAITHTVLGDTISAKPAYVREATFNYGGSYSAYASSKATRAPRVYVGANDGYLHAFDGDTGAEAWAYTPRFLMAGLYQLADHAYTNSTTHQYYVDGSPETGDVCATTACSNTSDWKTILVAGVNGGGRGYYALDISSMDTSTPGDDAKALWEFCADSAQCAISDPNLGLTFGNAAMGRRYWDNRSIVVLTSGLNNGEDAEPAGDGLGYFYVLDAVTGELLSTVSTGAGAPDGPSGLMKASAFFENALTDPRFRYVYAGDQLGNVWRLDLGGTKALPTDPDPAPVVIKLAELKDGSGRAQPITTRPALTHIGLKNVLYFGTGRYLGTPDLEDQGPGRSAWQHSLYAFVDCGTSCSAGSLRDNPSMKRRELVAISPTERGIADLPSDGSGDVDWTLPEGGWYIDFNPVFDGLEASPGEGVNIVDPRLVLGTLVVTTNAPAAGGSCSVGGTSYFYNFDFKEGTPVSTSPNGVVGVSLGGTITVGVAVVQLPSGAIKAISTGADTSKTTSGVSVGASGAAVKRFSYRVR